MFVFVYACVYIDIDIDAVIDFKDLSFGIFMLNDFQFKQLALVNFKLMYVLLVLDTHVFVYSTVL